jgi:predicted enzyme related to lactoylglutathione lyase
MRGASPENSTAFVRHGTLGKSCWNELSTSDAVAGNAFYAEVFGWTYPDAMTMPGDMGDYTFIDCAGQALGATMKASMPGQPIGWQPYFRVADVDAAAEMVTAHGGTVHMGPMEVPGGERIIVAADPAGTVVGFVAGAGQ